jgi:predicted transcriptional regulator of viral defense system
MLRTSTSHLSLRSDVKQQVVDSILELAAQRGVLRPRDVEALGLSRRELPRLRDAGLLEQPARGLYVRSDLSRSEHASLAEAATLVPRGVICLLSALQYHEFTTQIPHLVWIALQPTDWLTTEGRLPLKVVRFSGAAHTEGVEEHVIDGVTVRIYSPAKTVADCFKYRNKIGLDVALEALRDCWRQKKCSMDDLWHFARVCRVQNVMRPYLESLQ